MKTDLRIASSAASILAATATANESFGAPNPVEDLIARIKNPDENVSGPAWQSAHAYGPAAIRPLADLLGDPNFEIARSAKRALYKIVRHAGRPGAEKEARTVEEQLTPLLQSDLVATRREALWMLSEIGSDRAIAPMAALLTDKEAREDARCALTRLPGKKATAALKSAFATAPEEFKYALAESLRKRGENVEGCPTRKLVPSQQTTVKPVG